MAAHPPVQVTLEALSGSNTYSVCPALSTRIVPRPVTVLDEIVDALPCAVGDLGLWFGTGAVLVVL